MLGSLHNMRMLIKAVVGILLAVCASGCFMESDPKVTVTVIVTGVTDKADSEQVEKSLKDLVSGTVRYTSSSWAGGTLTMHLSPVSNFREFSEKIKFGRVTELQGNTVKVEFAKGQAV
jgi:hypothetical protein